MDTCLCGPMFFFKSTTDLKHTLIVVFVQNYEAAAAARSSSKPTHAIRSGKQL